MRTHHYLALLAAAAFAIASCTSTEPAEEVLDIPLPEHPRPDFQREGFINLNGHWHFTFDEALAAGPAESYDMNIMVPFPWGSALSEVPDSADVAWYSRQITVPSEWAGKRVFLVVGASDWETTAWIDGQELGSHQGGYTPFEFELTDKLTFGEPQTIKIKADDTPADWHLYGKQGYGNARGIWQTVYLEARGSNYISSLHFSPDIDRSVVKVDVTLDAEAAEGSTVAIAFKDRSQKTASVPVGGRKDVSFEIPLKNQHLWDINDPYLYEVTASLKNGRKVTDAVDSYFGQRKVSAMNVPGQDYKYVALNNSPLYLKLCLDQSYTPDGYYTFPSDEFMKNEILLSKKMGLNGNRIHIKVEVPRKLYWADKLGLLIMADVPNYWGAPVPEAKQEWENCMRAQVKRDFNHPCIFAWVDFNETWGLVSTEDGLSAYHKDTQEWVRSMYHLTKSLDPTRLVEDNSACNLDHVETDINSWHSYEPWHIWESKAALFDTMTVVGGTFNYIGGNTIQDVPMINSECGNVWGYQGCAGDCDYTWDYHEMMNAFHRHPHIAGWLYTEHHDVINEWNGYVQYDRTPKIDGLDEIVDGMKVSDFSSDYYIVPMEELCQDVPAGSVQTLTLCSSFTTAKDPGKLTLETSLTGCNDLGQTTEYGSESVPVEFRPFELAEVQKRTVNIPEENGVYYLKTILKNDKDEVLQHNFSMFVVKDAPAKPNTVTFKPADFTACDWSIKQKSIYGGLKVNGFGSGYFEYKVNIPASAEISGAELIFEASAKQLFGKDLDEGEADGNYMLGQGTFDHCKPVNSYAMTDDDCFTSEVKVTVNGTEVGSSVLADDPADHRGVLSWHAQPRERHMLEAGSYGYLVKCAIPDGLLKAGETAVIRFTVPQSAVSENGGGLALYGSSFGRYPMDPTIILKK